MRPSIESKIQAAFEHKISVGFNTPIGIRNDAQNCQLRKS